MNIFRRHFIRATAVAATAFLAGCERDDAAKDGSQPVLRVGFFPNITHAPALVGYHETQTKGAEGWFETRTGAKIEWYPFNAGPGAIEALFTGTVDVTYVGPNPVINGYTRARGMDIRVLSGAARGGAALVVRKDSPLKSAGKFPRQKNRHAATRRHAGCRGARVAHRGRAHDHAARRRRRCHPHGESRPARPLHAA